MGIWLIARDNIKKKKSNAILLFVMIAFATMLLYVGISVLTNLDKNIDNRNDMIHGADYISITSFDNDTDILDAIRNDYRVTSVESEKCLCKNNVKYYISESDATDTNRIDFIFQKKDVGRHISTINIIDEGKEWTHNSIILPYYMKAGLGYRTSDTIYLDIDDKIYNFIIYGFMDDVMFSTPTNIALERAFIDNDRYDELFHEWKNEVNLFKAILIPNTDTSQFESDMNELLKTSIPGYTDSFYITLNYETMRTGTSISALIFMGVLTVFAILLIVIAMVIINFNMNHSIEMNMRNIGILQASGYTNKQLVVSTILEIMTIGIFGVVVGLLCAKITSGLLGGIIAASIGMYWSIGFDFIGAICSILITLLMTLAAAFIGTSQYKKLNVLDALRNGIRTHNFKKNYIKLDKTTLPLNISLGFNNVLSRKGKNIIIMFIIALLTFCCNAALSMYQNFVKDNSNLLNVTGFEVPDVGIGFNMSNRYTQFELDDIEHRISGIDGIKEIKQYACNDMTCTSASGLEALNCDAYDDTNLYVDNIVSGRNAKSDDEVMLSTVIANRLDVSEGDVVYLEMNGNKQDYMICGIFQGINHLGKKAILSIAGMRRLDSTSNPYMIYVYKTSSASLDDLLYNLKSVVKDDNVTINNYKDYISSSMASVTSVMTIFSYIIILAVGLVIALVMMLLVKTQLVKDNRQYGIYKALGYTSGQLLLQTTMNYLPVVVLGTLLGCLLSVFFMNPLFVACLSMFGIRKCNMKLEIGYMIIMVIGIVLWSQVIIIVNSLKIRKIVPSKMIREN